MEQIRERRRNSEALADNDRCDGPASKFQTEVGGNELSDTYQAVFHVLRSAVKGVSDHIDDALIAVRREARMLFDALDLDRNGVLSHVELHTALDGLGFVQARASNSESRGLLPGAELHRSGFRSRGS